MIKSTSVLPSGLFPLLIEALHVETRAVVWSVKIIEPEAFVMVKIPALKAELGHFVAIRVTFGDGTVSCQEPRK